MSQPTDPQRDELQDRLMDRALREVLGGESPPDLSDKILAAVEKQGPVSTQRKERVMDKSRRGYRWWLLGALAVCLLVGIALALMMPGPARRVARDVAPSTAAPSAESHDTATGESAEGEMAPGAAHAQPQPQPPGAEMEDPAVDEFRRMRPPAPAEPSRKDARAKAPVAEPEMADFDALTDLITAPAEEPALEVDSEPSAPPPVGRLPERQREGWEDAEKSQLWGHKPEGQGPGRAGDRYDRLVENPFRTVKDHPLSTFSIDVDTASYANVRRFLLRESRMPPPDAVRIEELVNYFDYDYAGPEDDVPFAAHIEAAGCPWKAGHRLVRIGLKGQEIENEQRPASNLVFLLDVSGSMNSPDKLPLLKEGMKMLARQLGENDRVAIVVYASSEGLALPSTSGAEREKIVAALDRLRAGGSTAGGAGIELAYRLAEKHFIEGGVNRVLLCTDGDFNVGTSSTGDLVRMVEERAKKGIFLSVLGFGRGNLNDHMMESISNKGNGNYAYIDGETEAQKVLVEQMGGTLVTIAKDVKIQVEFNPARVAAYRLIGYENRILAAEDFNDDKKDAGEIGAGHTVTALYEVVPAGQEVDVPSVDPLKYQRPAAESDDESLSKEMLTLKLRYKAPDGDKSKLLEFPLVDEGQGFGQATPDFQFAAAVASFGMLLRGSEHQGTATYDAVLEIAASSQGPDKHGYRAEFLDLVRRANDLAD